MDYTLHQIQNYIIHVLVYSFEYQVPVFSSYVVFLRCVFLKLKYWIKWIFLLNAQCSLTYIPLSVCK